jgi:hypothetical protein
MLQPHLIIIASTMPVGGAILIVIGIVVFVLLVGRLLEWINDHPFITGLLIVGGVLALALTNRN